MEEEREEMKRRSEEEESKEEGREGSTGAKRRKEVVKLRKGGDATGEGGEKGQPRSVPGPKSWWPRFG